MPKGVQRMEEICRAAQVQSRALEPFQKILFLQASVYWSTDESVRLHL